MKRIALITIILLFIMFPASVFAILQGDIDNSGKIDLKDGIISLQTISGMSVIIPVYISADVDGDNKIGIAEAIYALQCIARLRNNHSPVLSPVGNQSVNEDILLTFKISSTDSDGDTPTYSAPNLPSGALIDARSGIFTWLPTFSQSGTYQVTFLADDSFGGTDSETITITVNNVNRSPVLNAIGNKSVDENSPLSFFISAADADGDTITYSVPTLPSGATFNASTRTFSWTPTYSQSGTYQITFTVSDNYGSSASETVTITVNNKVPVFNVSKITTLTTGDTLSSTFTGSDTAGGTYTGSTQSIIDGPTVFEGRNVIKKSSLTTLIKTGVGVILSSTQTTYYNTDRTLYKIVYSNGVTATPTSTFPIPTTIQIGNFAGQSLNYSNGNSETSTWQVVDTGNGNAKILVTTTTNFGLSDVYTIYIPASGNISTTTEVLYNFPSNGVTTTLTGIIN
ncbi:MAG: putative Ig domain-containing protein [Syntrophales bacterium]